jgi:hypothetical protein
LLPHMLASFLLAFSHVRKLACALVLSPFPRTSRALSRPLCDSCSW